MTRRRSQGRDLQRPLKGTWWNWYTRRLQEPVLWLGSSNLPVPTRDVTEAKRLGCPLFALVAQLAEYRTCNAEVAGSGPAGGSKPV